MTESHKSSKSDKSDRIGQKRARDHLWEAQESPGKPRFRQKVTKVVILAQEWSKSDEKTPKTPREAQEAPEARIPC